MKRVLVTLAVAASLVACKSKTNSQTEMVPLADPYNVNSDTAKIAKDMDTVVTTTTTTVTKTPVEAGTVTPAPLPTKKAPVRSAPVSNNSSVNTAPAPVVSAPAPVAAAEPEKKGWSKAAKGAVIGTVAGAATGAVITKDVKGAAIGGAVGAAGGYIIGRSKDRKDGRVKKDTL